MPLSSLDLHFIVKELQFLVGGRIDKVYHPKKEEIVLTLHVPSKGKQSLRIIVGKAFFLSAKKRQYNEPSGFCMYLRKQLKSARLRKLEQVGSDRIVKLGFERKEGLLDLYIELFGKGNLILVDENNTIVNCLEQKVWKDRKIRKGETYAFPTKTFDVFKVKKEEFTSLLKADEELVITLAKKIGLGGSYAEEVCTKAKVDKKKKRLTADEKDAVYKALQLLLKQPQDSLSTALDEQFPVEDVFVSKYQKDLEKAKKIVDMQDKQIKKLEKEAEENTKKGELIYEKYQEIESILKELKMAREKHSFKEIKKRLKGHKTIKEVDSRNKKISLEF